MLNGPNLGRLGTREPEVYGPTTYADLVDAVRDGRRRARPRRSRSARPTPSTRCSAGCTRPPTSGPPVVLNPGAWSHYSYAIRDACALLRAPLVEVHISNIHAREAFRHHSVVSAVATGVICGLGVDGYRLALQHLARPAAGADADDRGR